MLSLLASSAVHRAWPISSAPDSAEIEIAAHGLSECVPLGRLTAPSWFVSAFRMKASAVLVFREETLPVELASARGPTYLRLRQTCGDREREAAASGDGGDFMGSSWTIGVTKPAFSDQDIRPIPEPRDKTQ
jgi:hypothetical protein